MQNSDSLIQEKILNKCKSLKYIAKKYLKLSLR